MLKILLTNGDVRRWNPDEFVDYDIKGRFFVIINEKEQWVGMYALDHIISVEVDA